MFQCSSASRKFLNRRRKRMRFLTISCFSALQRAENSSIVRRCKISAGAKTFQCSSASRKFLNIRSASPLSNTNCSFSALQRAENSSIRASGRRARGTGIVSVLFSEPKIPQWYMRRREASGRVQFQCSSASRKFLNSLPQRASTSRDSVSVLFSEPKIPQ